jgi:CzcA family heavy metal efflux pump
VSLAEFATKHIKAILFTVIVLCGLGVAAYQTFPVSILPDVAFPRIVVVADAGERPTQSVEATIARPLEEALSTVANVRRVKSQTERGSTELSLDFNWNTDIVQAEQLVNAKVNETRPELPPETRIETERMNPTVFPVLGLTLNSDRLTQTELYNLAEYSLRPRLSRVEGVARVVIQGGAREEIAVLLDPSKLQALKIAGTDVVQALSSNSQVHDVGRVSSRLQQLHVTVDGQANSPETLGQIVVANRAGSPVTLSQIAEVKLSAADRTTVVSANGSECVLINVVRQPSANTLTMATAVKAEMDSLSKTLPNGVKLGIFYDQSILVGEAVRSVSDAVLIGAVLSVLVLMAFLGNVRATVVTAAIIPTTLLITFLLMRLAGLTLNLMTLGALAVGIGLVIDDAIVVVENVFKHIATGQPLIDAVQAASGEIARPMISSTITTVVVFLPLSLLQGVAGAFFSALALTLTIALMVSLFLALFASPSLCAAFLNARSGHKEGRLFIKFLNLYERLLRWTLRHKLVVPIGAILILAGTVAIGQRLKSGFMPEMDEGAFVLDYNTPPGTSLEESDRLLRKVDKILEATPEISTFSRRTGTELGFSITEPNRGDYAIMLKPDRKRKIDEVISDVRSQITGNISGLDVDFTQVLQDLINDLAGDPSPIDIKLFSEDKDSLESAADGLSKKLAGIKGLTDMKSGIIQLNPGWNLAIDPLRAGRYGLTTSQISDQAEIGVAGTVAMSILSHDRPVDVRVRFPFDWRSSPDSISVLPIVSASGATVPLSAVGDFTVVPGENELFRENERRMLDVSANLENLDLGTAVQKVGALMSSTPLPAGVTYSLEGQYKSQQDSFRNLIQVLAFAILLVYGVMVFQFGSFTAPTVILIVMPLGLFGAAAALWGTGTALNVSSFMGAIMLVGIVVKNGILLLDRATEAEGHGMSIEDAVIDAGRQRLRPILMTSLTAILGLVPLALGIGAGSEMQKPLAITVIGGLTFSTLATLVAAPSLYAAVRRKRAP